MEIADGGLGDLSNALPFTCCSLPCGLLRHPQSFRAVKLTTGARGRSPARYSPCKNHTRRSRFLRPSPSHLHLQGSPFPYRRIFVHYTNHLFEEWQLYVEPSALKNCASMIQRYSEGPAPYLTQYTLLVPSLAPSFGPLAHPQPRPNSLSTTIPSFDPGVPPPPAPSSGSLAHPQPSTNNPSTTIPSFGPGVPPSPAPSSGPFAHPQSSTNNLLTTIPSFGPGAPPSPPLTTSSTPERSRRTSSDSNPAQQGPPQLLPTPPSSHSNIPSPANSMSPVTPPNYEGDSAKTVSSAGSNTMQISGDSVSPPYHHAHTWKSSSPTPAHLTKTHAPIEAKHPSLKRSSSAYQHAAPVKSNAVYAFARLSTNDLSTTIPTFGPGAPPSPSSTTSSTPERSRRTSASSHTAPQEPLQLPLPSASHTNICSPADSMSLVTPPYYEGESAKILSSAGTNTISRDGVENCLRQYQHTQP